MSTTTSAQDHFVTGQLTTNGDIVQVIIPRHVSAAAIALSGTFTGTVNFEVSADQQNSWQSVNATPSNSTTPATSATATGVWRVPVSGYTAIRARGSTVSSGAVIVAISLSNGGIGI